MYLRLKFLVTIGLSDLIVVLPECVCLSVYFDTLSAEYSSFQVGKSASKIKLTTYTTDTIDTTNMSPFLLPSVN